LSRDAEKGHTPDPLPILDFFFGTNGGGEGIPWPWPSGLFIPGGADYRLYYLDWRNVQRPTVQNRYRQDWVDGNQPQANHASARDGSLFSYVFLSPTDSLVFSNAGIGLIFHPPHTLATYAVGVKVTMMGMNHYNVATTAPAAGNVRELGGLLTSAWEISPV